MTPMNQAAKCDTMKGITSSNVYRNKTQKPFPVRITACNLAI